MYIVDMHCDTISELVLTAETNTSRENKFQDSQSREMQKKHVESMRKNSKHVDLLRMKDAGYLLQNFALYVNRQTYPDVKSRVLELLRYYRTEMKQNADLIAPVTCMADIEKNCLQGKMSAMLTLEEGAALEGSVDTLKEFYGKGIRMITLTWNYPNELGYPHGYNDKSSVGEKFGLTCCGFEMVEAMESLGVIVDVSHLSDDGFYDVLHSTKKPFVASHSNAREVCPMSRNLSDDMIRRLACRGGVMGLNFYPPFLGDDGTIEAVIRHAKRIVNVGGMDVLGLGSDFDGIDGQKELTGVQDLPRLADAFAKAGFRASDIEKIFSGNVLRVYKDVIG